MPAFSPFHPHVQGGRACIYFKYELPLIEGLDLLVRRCVLRPDPEPVLPLTEGLRLYDSLTARLLEVDGIGEARVTALYRHFKTNKAMKAATKEELAAVKGMNRDAAEKLYAFLHESD